MVNATREHRFVDREETRRQPEPGFHAGTYVTTRCNRPAFPPLVSGRGELVRDALGRILIDFSSQTQNLNFGQCHPKIVAAVQEAAGTLTFASSRFMPEAALELAQRIVSVAPEGMNRINLKMCNGSDAVEGAIKMARKFTGKGRIISLIGAHHGESIETMKLSDKHDGKSFLGDASLFSHIPPPYREVDDTASINACESVLKAGDVAAVIVEPVLVNGGAIVLSKGYLAHLKHLCEQYGALLIFDEIQTAFGWLGERFASGYFGVTPDILTLGKGISGGFPLAAILFNEEHDVLDYGEHDFTYGAHPLSCAAALAVLDLLEETNVLAEVPGKGRRLAAGLEAIKSDSGIVGEIRHAGMILGMEMVDSDGIPAPHLAAKVFRECLAKGLLARVSQDGKGNVILIKPPLIIREECITRGLDVVGEVVRNAGESED